MPNNSKQSYLNRKEIKNLFYFILFFFWLVFSYGLISAFYLSAVFAAVSVFFGALFFGYCVLQWLHPRNLPFYVFVSSLVLSQLIWPIHFIYADHWTAGALLLIVYFTWWDIFKRKIQGELNLAILLRDIFFGAAGIAAILISGGIMI